ncbi:unnamed protein product [Caenorhabditis bovis]|uniref:Transcriptional repressor p66 coiled-coil MBD2-interaction domain-containing protein n=1 Tax=Caenorhabditis bovis TaxID=2654633 RepID=A0A8S1F487_9PELO|nr:unnamed protein product [Caenorhabditis bovis]
MAQVETIPKSTLNGVSENGSNGNQMDIDDHLKMHNGTPTKEGYPPSSSSNADHEESVQWSPASLRRRSTRASALKAQEKIKLKDDVVQDQQHHHDDDLMDDGDDDGNDEVPTKKKKLENGRDMDQLCFRFGLRANEDGDVYALTDESENSSIRESEMEIVRAHYEKALSREMTQEQLNERLMMRKEAESKLRQEEAGLALLKKMKQSQAIALQKLAESKKLTANLPNMTNTGAYKPVIAPPLSKHQTAAATAMNGKKGSNAPATRNAALLALNGMTPQQQQELLTRLAQNPAAAAQALLLSKTGGSNAQVQQMLAQLVLNAQQQMSNKDKSKEASAISAAAATTATTPASSLTAAQAKLMASQTPQQRSLAARMAFRAQADKQLMMVSAPKAPPPDMFFIPNASQPAFTYLLGLDLVVQRVLKDKSLEKKVSEPCYECEECHTDFTPTWKAIGTSPDDLHLYCEQCVRQAQKRKIRMDHSNFLKKAYQKISAQEKEFEKKIAEGTLEQVFEQARPPTVAQAATPTNPAVSRVAAASTSSGSSTPTASKSTNASSSKSASSSSSSNSKKNAAAAQQQMQAFFMQQMMANPMTASMMRNPAMLQQMSSSTPSTSSSTAAAAAAATSASALQQQQLAALAAAIMQNGSAAAAAGVTTQMMTPQIARAFSQMTSAQQKQFIEMMRHKK